MVNALKKYLVDNFLCGNLSITSQSDFQDNERYVDITFGITDNGLLSELLLTPFRQKKKTVSMLILLMFIYICRIKYIECSGDSSHVIVIINDNLPYGGDTQLTVVAD